MQPNTLLMCKLLLLLLVIHGFYWTIRDPYLPFLQGLDVFRAQPGLFEFVLKAAFVAAGLALLYNVRVRTSAIVLGATVILAIVHPSRCSGITSSLSAACCSWPGCIAGMKRPG